MARNVFSLESFYKTQPPEQIGESKVSGVLEYLAFSGTIVYLTNQDQPLTGGPTPGVVVDVLEDRFLIESGDLKVRGPFPVKVSIALGYKRKRAFMQTSILGIESDWFVVEKPKEIILTNLRRNPRVQVEPELFDKGLRVKIDGKTSIGELKSVEAQMFEMSQLGTCLFVDRASGLLLPGDAIESLEIYDQGNLVLKTSGVVSRVDMKRHSPNLPNSYQVVVLFRPQQSGNENGVRSAKRVPVLDEKPCFFSAEHPLFPGRSLQGQVYEVSTSGLAVMVEKTSFPIIAGMRFYNCNLQLPHRPLRDFVFHVAHVDFQSDGNLSHFRVGGEFVKASIELIKDITSYSQDASGSLIQDVSQADLDLLWEFMFETNFIYQDKRRLLQSRSKEIISTYHRLLSTDNPLVKKMIYKEKDEIRGHISSIRFYERTWIIQHLNALKTANASGAQQVLTAITNFFYDSKAFHKADVFYVMSFYRPNNLYPAIVFGETCRRINDRFKCITYDFSYGIYQSVNLVRREDPLMHIDRPHDMNELTDLLISNKMVPFMRAVGLSQPADWSSRLKDDYKSQGLMRDRHLLYLEDGDEMVFAVAELASVGLNLSELTNAIYLFSKGVDSEKISRMAGALVEKASQIYFEPRGISPVVLQPEDSVKAQNVNWSKTYTCWILSATAVPDFEIHSKSVLADFKELVAKFKNSPVEADPGNRQSAGSE